MPSSDPAAGYLSDTTYPDRFHPELSPAWLTYVARQAGVAGVPLGERFTYLDLGCGFARTTIVNAGAFPHAEFHACDFNAAHIEGASRYATELGVGNVTFHQTYFAEILERDLPAFDFIVLHGIYSWVAPEVRETILRIVSEKLQPEGLVYVSYNCLPGWASEAPLRRLMLEIAAHEAGGADRRADSALHTLQAIGHSSFRYFRHHPAAVATLDAWAQDPSNYVAHECLNPTWSLFYSLDVADELARAGVSYLGSATLADNLPVLLVDRAAAEIVGKMPARLRELALDFAVDQRFRRDVFVQGRRPSPAPAEALRILDDAIVGCATDVDRITTSAVVRRGKITFHGAFVRELRALMDRGSMSLGHAAAALGGAGRDPIEIRQNLVFLVAAGVLSPFAEERVDGVGRPPGEGADRVVANALRLVVERGQPAFVPSAALGGGVLVEPKEALEATRWLAGASPAPPPPRRLARLGILPPAP